MRELASAASVKWDLTATPKNASCPSDRCPSYDSTGATFNQREAITINDDALDLSTNEFSFALWMKPEDRFAPFDPKDVDKFDDSHVDHDANEDWQGVFGYQRSSKAKRIYPSMYVSDAGRLRMVMGDGSDICTYETPVGVSVIQYDIWQHVAVIYSGSGFMLYVDGDLVDSKAINDCANVSLANIPTKLEIGRPNDYGYLDLSGATFTHIWDGSFNDKTELCLEYNDEVIWRDFNGPVVNAGASSKSVVFDKQYVIGDDATNWFRLSEDDNSGADNCAYRPGGEDDDNILHRDNISNRISQLGDTYTTINKSNGSDGTEGHFSWSLSNDFFVGSLNDFRFYSYALSPNLVDKVYENATFGLLLPLDEPPGEQTFQDISASGFIGTCNDLQADSCPDSGIPGRINQALRFDGVNDTVRVAPQTVFELENGGTLMAWVKPTWNPSSNGYNPAILAVRDDTGVKYSIHIRDDLSGLDVWTGIGGVLRFYHAFPKDEWTHVALVNSNQSQWDLYLNGQHKDTASGTLGSGTKLPLYIGSATDTNNFFTGLLDDVRILKVPLDQQRIRVMMDEAPVVNLHLDEDLIDASQGSGRFVNEGNRAFDAQCAGTACPQAGDKGQMREAPVFDGNDLLTSPDGGNLPTLDTFTVGMWVKPTQKTSYHQWLILKADGNGYARNFGLRLNANSMKLRPILQYECRPDSGSWKYLNSQGTLLENQWNHVVMTYDGSDLRLYINGTEDRGGSF